MTGDYKSITKSRQSSRDSERRGGRFFQRGPYSQSNRPRPHCSVDRLCSIKSSIFDRHPADDDGKSSRLPATRFRDRIKRLSTISSPADVSSDVQRSRLSCRSQVLTVITVSTAQLLLQNVVLLT